MLEEKPSVHGILDKDNFGKIFPDQVGCIISGGIIYDYNFIIERVEVVHETLQTV